jgi:hypothetical protein
MIAWIVAATPTVGGLLLPIRKGEKNIPTPETTPLLKIEKGQSISGPAEQGGLVKIKDFRVESKGESFEIEGVCRLDEKSVSCWTPDGLPSKEMTKQIDAELRMLRPPQNQMGFSFGKKNRMLIYKSVSESRKGLTLVGYPQRRSGIISGFKEGWDQPTFGIQTLSNEKSGQFHTTRHMVVGSFEKSTNATSFLMRMPLKPVWLADIPFKQSSTVSIGGNGFEIAGLTKHHRSGFFSGMTITTLVPIEACYVDVKLTDKANPYMGFYLAPMNEKGEVWEYVNEKGEPIGRDEFMKKYIPDDYRSEEFIFPNMLPITIQYDQVSMMPQGSFSHYFPIGASKISALKVSVVGYRVHEFEGIRLDPK